MEGTRTRTDLYNSGAVLNYIRKRKQYMKEEVFITPILYNGSLHNHYVDRETQSVLWNDVPRRPEYFGLNNQEEVQECEKARLAIKRQVMRLKHHLLYMLAQQDYEVFFITLTFSDETLQSTNADTRKQKVRRTLTEVCEDFVANIDYAPDTGREHYHGIIALPKGKAKKEKHWQCEELSERYGYGHINIEPVRQTKKSLKAVPRYIDKLALHAFKERQTSIITKRTSRYHDEKKSGETVCGMSITALQKIVFERWKTADENDSVVSRMLDIFGINFDIED